MFYCYCNLFWYYLLVSSWSSSSLYNWWFSSWQWLKVSGCRCSGGWVWCDQAARCQQSSVPTRPQHSSNSCHCHSSTIHHHQLYWHFAHRLNMFPHQRGRVTAAGELWHGDNNVRKWWEGHRRVEVVFMKWFNCCCNVYKKTTVNIKSTLQNIKEVCQTWQMEDQCKNCLSCLPSEIIFKIFSYLNHKVG